MRLLCRLPWPSAREPTPRPPSVHSISTGFTVNPPDEPLDQPKSTLGLSPLSNPEHPDIDLVFVHGLGGDARKTWGTTDGQSACWPADWLPLEDGFDRVRVQTFGYDTKFLKGPGNCLNVHHLGKLLLGEVETSPTIGLAKTKIVFIAHSMGGLVVKKAFLLAKKDPTYHELAERMEAVIFLACPHHGADSAKLLRRVLSPIYDRQYLADLERNSPTLQAINNDFRTFAADLALWSFYETQKMNRWTPLVVDEMSAVLNYPDEKQRPMVADHRSICKFDSPQAPNYLTIRNSLAFVVNDIRTKTSKGALLESATQGRTIRELLGYNAPTDDVLDSLSEKREPGSCDWILSNNSFTSWASQSQKGSILLWISGKPGWGKSTLAGFVVDHLRDIECQVHSYFFQFSTHRKSTFEDCLRSLSYQIALSNETCRESLLRLHAEGVRLDGMQARPFWNTIARYGAFENIQGRQYCVIDGLDECGEPQVVIETLAQILEETSSAEFRLLVVGRELPGLQGYTFHTGRCIRLTLEASHTSAALAKVVRSRIPLIPTIKETDRDQIGDRIVHQAQGSFLFADLILQDLAGCHDQAEVSRILESLPAGMEPVYGRIVESIAQNATSRELSQAILSWIICASRPLTVDELQIALEIDLGTTFTHLSESITTLCGQLVTVDQIGRIKLQHETARHFLLNSTRRADFSFDEGECNARIARTCLKLFLMRDFRRNLISGGSLAAFDTYALLELPLHLSKAAETSPQELLDSSERFFKSHILDWVKLAIQHRGPGYLNVTSERLSLFCDRCPAKTQSSRSFAYMSRISADLLQLSRKFGGALASNPSAIHTTVPFFCPSQSTIYKARKQNERLKVVGDLGAEWSGTLSSISLESRAMSVAVNGLHLAIGLRFGVIVVFNTTAYKQVQRLEHREEIEHIAFSEDGSYLASSSKDSTKVWSLKHGQTLHHFHHNNNRPLGLAFDGSRLLTPRRDDICFAWDLRCAEAEEPLEDMKIHFSDHKFLRATISTSARLAVSRDNNLIVLDLDTGELIPQSFTQTMQDALDAKKTVIIDISLNPVNGLLAMLRGDELLILDLRQNEVLQRCDSEGVMLTTSCNGRLLAVLETKPGFSANVKLYNFDSLSFLLEISTGTDDIEFLSFAKNDSHLMGIYGRHANQCLAWALPTDIACLSAVPDIKASHESTLQFSLGRIVGLGDVETLLAPSDESFMLCARADGAVAMFDSKTANFQKIVFQSHCPIRCLEWWPAYCAVLCISIDNTVTLQRLPADDDQVPISNSCIFSFRVDTKYWIFDLCIAQEDDMFLISDIDITFAYSKDGKLLGTASFKNDDNDRRFAVLPQLSGHALCFNDHEGVRILSTCDIATTLRNTDITGFVDVPWRKSVYSAFHWQRRLHFGQDNRFIVTQGRIMNRCHGPKGLLIRLDLGAVLRKGTDTFLTSSPDEDQVPGTPVCYSDLYNVPVRQIVHVLDDETVIFIDDSMWLCSLNLAEAEPVSSFPWSDGSQVTACLSYNRHFFIPADFFKGEEMEASCAMVGPDLALALNGRPILVKGFLEHRREVRFDSYVSSEVLYASRSPTALVGVDPFGSDLRASL